ncbi:hypothetical protein EOL96_04365, partial [Candidatus Saccharibacteria bacterium]|nr:hypothetical protein [Candidatus Saccharibacteria bacterium]
MSTTTTMRLGASIVIAMASIGFAVVPGEYAQATKTDRGQNTTHLVFCQKTGNHWTITKGDNPSDNKNRFQVGTWNEHER